MILTVRNPADRHCHPWWKLSFFQASDILMIGISAASALIGGVASLFRSYVDSCHMGTSALQPPSGSSSEIPLRGALTVYECQQSRYASSKGKCKSVRLCDDDADRVSRPRFENCCQSRGAFIGVAMMSPLWAMFCLSLDLLGFLL